MSRTHIGKNIYNKAKKILHKEEELFNQFNTALSAGICPKCGKNLVLETKKWMDLEKRGLIFKKDVNIPRECDYFACPDRCPIIDPHGCHRSNPGYIYYDGANSPNKVIRDYWLDHFSGGAEDNID